MAVQLQNEQIAAAIYANLFDQQQGSELYRLFLSAPEIAGSRNSNQVKVRRFGALTASLYAGAGTIALSSDYQRPADTTITVNFNLTALVPVGIDNIDHEITELGLEGSRSGMAQDAASAVRDFVTANVLDALVAGVAAGNVLAQQSLLRFEEFKQAGQKLDAAKVDSNGRVAILDAEDTWDLFDGTSKIGIDAREIPTTVAEGRIGTLAGFETFKTTLMTDLANTPTARPSVFAHRSGMIAKAADELPNVKILPDPSSIGDLLQVFLRFGRTVADGNRVVLASVNKA